MKDTFFSLPRFMNLCRKEMVENWRSNVLRMVLWQWYWFGTDIFNTGITILLILFVIQMQMPILHGDLY